MPMVAELFPHILHKWLPGALLPPLWRDVAPVGAGVPWKVKGGIRQLEPAGYIVRTMWRTRVTRGIYTMIYEYAIVISHTRRGLRRNVPLVLRRPCRIPGNTNPRTTRALCNQRFAQGSNNAMVRTAGTILFLKGLLELKGGFPIIIFLRSWRLVVANRGRLLTANR